MTDVPRRSYPLVVAPPGGFEDAVSRGRRLRRRRAGGSSGVALVLAGALGWSVLGGGSGVDRIEPTRDDRGGRSTPIFGEPLLPSETPNASLPPGTRPGAIASQGPGSAFDPRPSAGPSVVVQPSRSAGTGPEQPRRYAARPRINRDGAQPNTDPNCLSQQDLAWCPKVVVDESRAASEGIYGLSYTLCRSVNAEPGTLTFDLRQEIEFRATDTSNNDTVWTYSAGQPRVNEPETVTIQPGSCIRWHLEWDGYDDFGYTPPAGPYSVWAKPLSRETAPAAEDTFTHH